MGIERSKDMAFELLNDTDDVVIKCGCRRVKRNNQTPQDHIDGICPLQDIKTVQYPARAMAEYRLRNKELFLVAE